MGFPVPVGSWLRGRFWPLAEELLLSPRALERGLFDPQTVRRLAEEHRRGVAEHGERLWLLANLEILHRGFLENDLTLSLGRAALRRDRSATSARAHARPRARRRDRWWPQA